MTPFITESHHQVLEGWAVAAAEHGRLDLFTLDYHTDTLPAFSARLSPLKGEERERESLRMVNEVQWHDRKAVREAITRLRYDEHIDCAKKAGILGTIVVGLGCRDPQHQPAFATVCMPEERPEREMVDALLEDATLAPWVALFEAQRGRPLEEGGYIFDVDLDYFRTERASLPETHAVLDRLIRNATLLTIAREPGCVGLLRLKGEYIISADLEKNMLAHISRRGYKIKTVQKVVMIAHQDPTRLERCLDLLDGAGFRCLAVHTGNEALATAATYAPQVAVLQIELPEIQGTDVCLRLKQEAPTKDMLVLLLGTDSTQERFVSDEVGADAFLVEPAGDEQLIEKVRELFQRSWQKQA